MTEREWERRNVLSIAFKVVGVLTFGSAALALLITQFAGSQVAQLSAQFGVDSPVGHSLKMVGVLGGLKMLLGYAQIRAGFAVAQRKQRVFALVVAAISAMIGMHGIVLCVFAFAVLHDSGRGTSVLTVGPSP